MSTLLSVQNLTMQFGGLVAVDQLGFSVEQHHIHGLIGPNGAGKTTTFNAISGFYTPTGGAIEFNGHSITGQSMHEVARQGLLRTFQHSTLFGELTVLENVVIGTHRVYRPNVWKALIGADWQQRRDAESLARDSLEFFGLSEHANALASSLSHGHQRALGLAVAMAAKPTMLLLDEPFTGMNPEETAQMMTLMRKLQDSGITLLLVEHDMQAIMGLCDKITCMSFGKLLAEGTATEIRHHPDVIEAYLGGARHVA